MRRTRFPTARVYGSVRSAHLERARALPPASILHRRWRYDLDPALTEGVDLIRGGTLSTAVTVARSRLTGLEVHEPLLRSGLWRTAVAVTVARIAGALRRTDVTIASYAIENRDNYRPEPAATWRRRVRRRSEWVLSRYVARRLDRMVYGTRAAAELYGTALAAELEHCTTCLIPALPSPCGCPVTGSRDADLVLFVGAFVARKGLPELLAAWPEVLRRRPSARLVLVGQGALEHRARDLADEVAGVEVTVAPPREEIHRLLRRAAVLVLLSQRTPSWREQVGLPIVEGLAHGCSVVTTEETGLADWLTDHGHDVVTSSTPDDVAEAIAAALERGRSAASVLADLPSEDGRLAADAWMFGTAAAEPSAGSPGQRVRHGLPARVAVRR
jgi:glycosyltransferase involved in cell wall biosynthesis